ncbi:helix-turn-helix domain-containing protein [Sinorhizobium meliloti]
MNFPISLYPGGVRLRSFRKAADQLDLSVSALSDRMKSLEARLGV